MARLVKPLTATQVQNAKPKDKPYKLFDGGGLFLHVTPSGGKHWKMKFKQAKGKENLLSFGAYPEVSLEQARRKRDEARTQKAAGKDFTTYATTEELIEALRKNPLEGYHVLIKGSHGMALERVVEVL